MSYTVESESYGRARKRRRTAITLLVVSLILAGTYYYASSYWKRGPSASATPSCTPTVPATGVVSPSQVTLNVYNATKRNGLAATVAKSLKERGFRIGAVANDPVKGSVVPQPAQIRYGPAGQRAAELVMTTVAGAVAVADTRADASIDLVIGDGFQQLAPAPTTGTPAPASC